MKKKQKSITDGSVAALGAARRGAKLVIEPRGAYNATSKLHDFDGECGAANRLRIRPTLLATAPTASSRTAPTTHDSAMPARPQLPMSAGPRRPIPLGWSKLQPPRNPWFRSRTTGRLPGRTRPRASVSSQMRGVPRGWWLGGSCGFVLQLRYVDPKVDVFLVQIARRRTAVTRVRQARCLFGEHESTREGYHAPRPAVQAAGRADFPCGNRTDPREARVAAGLRDRASPRGPSKSWNRRIGCPSRKPRPRYNR